MGGEDILTVFHGHRLGDVVAADVEHFYKRGEKIHRGGLISSGPGAGIIFCGRVSKVLPPPPVYCFPVFNEGFQQLPPPPPPVPPTKYNKILNITIFRININV